MTFETESFWVFRDAAPIARAWCPTCGAETDMISLERAGALVESKQPKLLDLVGTKQLHTSETADGPLRICLRSLLEAAP